MYVGCTTFMRSESTHQFGTSLGDHILLQYCKFTFSFHVLCDSIRVSMWKSRSILGISSTFDHNDLQRYCCIRRPVLVCDFRELLWDYSLFVTVAVSVMFCSCRRRHRVWFAPNALYWTNIQDNCQDFLKV